MTPHLARFIQSFRTEEELRDNFAVLLSKMPNTESVQVTHGSHEIGKDIVFYGVGGLGERRLYACVAKNEKITGSAASKSGARNVLIQAQQALDSAFINEKGTKELVEHIYIICPHDCSPATMSSIQGWLQHRTGQVTFCCGTHLLRLFQKHWPEYCPVAVLPLHMLEGVWRSEATDSTYCMKVVSGELRVAYAYGSTELTSHFYDCRVIADWLVCRFEWFFRRDLKGFVALHPINSNTLEGGYSLLTDLYTVVRDRSQLHTADRMRMFRTGVPGFNEILLQRRSKTGYPKWAQEYFTQYRHK